MHKRNDLNPDRPANGLTAIELLIITSVIAIITIFAAPMLSKAAKPSDIDLAIQITESFVDHARATARVYKTDVLMHIEPINELGQQAFTLIIPAMKQNESMTEVKEKFLLPAGVQLFSDDGVIHFLPNGEIAPPTHTLVLSNPGHDKDRQVVIQ